MPRLTLRPSAPRTKTDGPRPFPYVSLLLLLLGLACLASVAAPYTSRAAGSGEKPAAPPARTLSLEERVAYRRAVEEVYWRHTEWPEANRQPKPGLDEVVPVGATRAKVEDGLRKSDALARLWNDPITPEQLQAEVARMARETKQPGVLRELWRALGDDPFVVAEVLARPALADRRARGSYSYDERIHGPLRERAAAQLSRHATLDELRRAGVSFSEVELVKTDGEAPAGAAAEGGAIKLGAAEWDAERARLAETFGGVELPAGAVSDLQESADGFYAVSVLAGTKKSLTVARVEWPKVGFDSWWSGEGAKFTTSAEAAGFDYRLAEISAAGTDDTWTPTRAMPVATGTAVWTGSEMIVWGGLTQYGGRTNSGARYNPATDTWTPTGTVGAPLPRAGHAAYWTGTDMLVWGGVLGTFVGGHGGGGNNTTNTGGRYNTLTDAWTPTSTVGAPFTSGLTVWTGAKMLVWGGSAVSAYDLSSDTWKAGSPNNSPGIGSKAVWTGAEMFVWGGVNNTTGKRGGLYNPATDTWRQPNTFNAPSERTGFSLVWTGAEAVVWGGYEGNNVTLNTGGRYNPSTDTWAPTSTANAPAARYGHVAVWTGSEMVVHGGDLRPGGQMGLTNTGARYDPAGNSWTPTQTVRSPVKFAHVAVWTGSEVIVWGGSTGSGSFQKEAARYSPSKDSWTPANTNDAPLYLDRGVWTGAEMLVWGQNSLCYLCDSVGGRYDPATDVWRPMNLTGAPVAGTTGYGTNAVWTGKEMIVWGGGSGRYNPLTDTWAPVSTTDAPAGGWTAVWSGKEMIVWGNSSQENADAGGRYNPETDTWRPTSTTGAPAGRYMHTAVWAGTEMIVWGGVQFGVMGKLNTGGRYNPETDTWRPTTTAGAPEGRTYHTAVWAGSRMVVWGGGNDQGSGNASLVNTGGRYDPVGDAWTPTSTQGAPEARSDHRAVWTGSQMIVWGGTVAGVTGPFGTYTGARYNPQSDTWVPTSTLRAPSRRSRHVQVWTGTQMIVWGGLADEGAATHGAVYNAPGAAQGNAPPAVRLTSPAENAPFVAGDQIQLAAEASDGDGAVSSVSFYANDTLLGTDREAPFAFNWVKVRSGSYAVTAVAADDGGATTRSAPVSVNVEALVGPPNAVITSPADQSSFEAPAAIRVAADVTPNPDYDVTKVEFWLGDGSGGTQKLVHTDTAAPYGFDLAEQPAGTYVIYAYAYDGQDVGISPGARYTVAGPPRPFNISGRVADGRGLGLANIPVNLTGADAATAKTDANGYYFFGGLVQGGNYTVTPAASNYAYAPQSLTFNNLGATQSGADFIATQAGYGISGHLRDAGGNPVYPATVNLSGSKTASTGTDVNGYYFFSNLAPGGTYTVQPYKNLYGFEPNFRTFANLSAEQTADFTATPQTTTHAVAGRVVDDKGAPVAGLRIKLNTVRVSSTQFRTTDADGRYSFGAIPAGETCSVFPEDFTYAYGFTPYFPRSYQALSQDVADADFVATPRTVSGRISQAGSGVGGVSVTLSGPQGGTATTGEDGAFAFRGVTLRGDYTVSASKAGYALTPAQHTVKDLKEDATADFAAAATPPPLLQFGAAASTAGEGAGAVSIAVTRTGDTSQAVSVNFATSDGTAAAGSDYAAASGTLNFAAGETQKTFAVHLADDALDEADETIILTLSNPAGGAALGAPATATLTAGDDDAPPSLSITDAAVAEGNTGAAVASFAVTLSAPSGRVVTALAATADGTAAAGSDYASGSGALTFAPGETSKTFTVQVNGDTADEADETFFVNLSAVTNAAVGDAQGVGTIGNDDGAQLQFARAVFPAAEGAYYAAVTVTRAGDPAAPLTVGYETQDGTASRLSDYTSAAGTLEFAAGETSKTFFVLLTDDGYQEGEETVRLVLSNPTGGAALGGQAAAEVLIEASDDPPPASNPADDPAAFVRQHYHDFFSREPDAPGLAHWAGVVESCGADAQCREVRRINTSGAFFLSIEFTETGYLVERLYKAAYGDAAGASTLGGAHQLQVPIIRLDEFLPDTQRVGRGVVVNAPGWEAQLEANKVAFTREFVRRPRFTGAYPWSMTPEQFVDQLNARAGGPLDAAERQALVAELSAGYDDAGRARALRKVAEDATLREAEKNRAFVLMQYFGYLRRNPNGGQDTDYTGYDFWLGNLERAGGNFVQAELVKAFISSIEYRRRFGL